MVDWRATVEDDKRTENATVSASTSASSSSGDRPTRGVGPKAVAAPSGPFLVQPAETMIKSVRGLAESPGLLCEPSHSVKASQPFGGSGPGPNDPAPASNGSSGTEGEAQ